MLENKYKNDDLDFELSSEEKREESKPENGREPWEESEDDELFNSALNRAEEARELEVVRAQLRVGLRGGREGEEEAPADRGARRRQGGGMDIFGTPLKYAWRGTWGRGWADAAYEEQAGEGGGGNMSLILQELAGVIAVVREEWRPLWAAHNQLTHRRKESIERLGSYWSTWRSAAKRVKGMAKELTKLGHMVDPRVGQALRGEGEPGEVVRWSRTRRLPTVTRPGSLEAAWGLEGGEEVAAGGKSTKKREPGKEWRQLALEDLQARRQAEGQARGEEESW